MSRRDLLTRATLAGAIALAGLGTTISLAVAGGMTWTESLRLFAVAAGPLGAAGLVAAVALVAIRRTPVSVQAVVVVVATLGGVGLGAEAAARSMFLTAHDLNALAVILAAALTVGILVALALGFQVERASRTLRAAARRMAAGDLSSPVEATATAELEALGRDLQEMSRRLDEARSRERAMDDSRRELVAWISHDLRTPLAAIRAVAEALEDGVVDDPEEVSSYYGTLRSEADRLAGMVDDLFELSRLNAGAFRLEMERASLIDLVSDALGGAAVMARAKGVHLEGAMDGGTVEVSLSTPEMGRALRNLLENAIRHTPSDGSVWVEAGVDGDRAYVSVADGCGGIPERDLDRVFELAYRGEVARTPSMASGAGLGLAIARGIAEAHHGGISVRNEGPGCRFTLTVPLATQGDGAASSTGNGNGGAARTRLDPNPDRHG